MIRSIAARAGIILLTLLAPAAARAAPGDTIAVGNFSAATPGGAFPAGWKPLIFPRIERHTEYLLVQDKERGTVVRARAEASASGLTRAIDVDPQTHPILRWQWRAEKLLARGDVTRKDGDDFPVRIYVTFAHSPERLGFAERAKVAAARLLYGETPPHAALTFVWDARAPAGTAVRNPYSDRVQMVVVESGPTRLGQWLVYERNVFEDYRRAFGEDPPRISGVAIMTDTDNTGESVTGWYGDIEFRAVVPR